MMISSMSVPTIYYNNNENTNTRDHKTQMIQKSFIDRPLLGLHLCELQLMNHHDCKKFLF